ncbi:serine protease 55-like [Heterodontus francisci]|uniref:serine protease 55-like n=1 Tax=Heterodontus francisci TaxID=7792 RepID=UPI00355B50C7
MKRVCRDRSHYRQKRLESQIIGGSDTKPGDWPWQVSLRKGGTHICGGSILSQWWLLTAAHCVKKIRPEHISVETGTILLGHHKAQRHEVTEILIHQHFNHSTLDNDIAMLLLKAPITFNGNQMPVLLPLVDRFNVKAWAPCYVIGWGTTEYERRPVILQEVEVALIDWHNCRKWMTDITRNMLCAGYEEGGRDACQGDSGGPLMCEGKTSETWIQVGIVSWGNGCAESQSPDLFKTYLVAVQHNTMEGILNVKAGLCLHKERCICSRQIGEDEVSSPNFGTSPHMLISDDWRESDAEAKNDFNRQLREINLQV